MKTIVLKKYFFLTALFLILIISPSALLGESSSRVIGWSAGELPLRAFSLGSGERNVVLIGGIHGGYEWNTIILTQQLLSYFQSNPEEIPENITLHFIPNANPDGLTRVTRGAPLEETDFSDIDTRPGRFNGNDVDLNRNWGYRWEPKAYWGSREVSPGKGPFSEPETRALRDFIEALEPAQVIFYHSAAHGIYYGGKREGWDPAKTTAELYSQASGYPIPQGSSLMKYPITGAASSHLYSLGIPSMTIELSTHRDIEFSRNLRGVKAVLEYLTAP